MDDAEGDVDEGGHGARTQPEVQNAAVKPQTRTLVLVQQEQGSGAHQRVEAKDDLACEDAQDQRLRRIRAFYLDGRQEMIGIDGDIGEENDQQQYGGRQEKQDAFRGTEGELHSAVALVDQDIEENAKGIADLPEDPEPARSRLAGVDQAMERKYSWQGEQIRDIDQTDVKVGATEKRQRWRTGAEELSEEQVGGQQSRKHGKRGEDDGKGGRAQTTICGVGICGDANED